MLNNPNLEFFPIAYEDPAWLKFREDGIGGSEIGVLLGLVDKYSSPAQIFSEKVGLTKPWSGDNNAVFWGRTLEPIIRENWEYWDGEPDGYIHNKKIGQKIRTCSTITGYVRNKKWPWLFASVDGIIDKDGGYNLITGEALEKGGILEIKTIEDRTADQYEGGVPPYHIAQVNQYMLIFEVDYAELAILENGRRMSVLPLERSDVLCKSIISTSKAFWEKRVVPAKEAFYKANKLRAMGRETEAEKYDAIIQHLEPDATPGESYKQFLSERYTKRIEEMDATSEMILYGIMHKSASECIKYFESRKSLATNKIGKMLSENHVEYAKHGAKGYLRYMKTSGTSVFRVDNRLKLDLDEDKLDRVMSQIDINYVKWRPEKPTVKKK